MFTAEPLVILPLYTSYTNIMLSSKICILNEYSIGRQKYPGQRLYARISPVKTVFLDFTTHTKIRVSITTDALDINLLFVRKKKHRHKQFSMLLISLGRNASFFYNQCLLV